MRTRIFPQCYSTDYAASTAASWIKAFEAWHEDKDYCLTVVRSHINVVRRVFETHGPIALDTYFSDADLVRMFKTKVRPGQFSGARRAFAHFLRDRGQWDATRLRCRHSDLLDKFEHHLVEMRGLAPATTAAHLVIVREFLNAHCGATRQLNELTSRDVERFIAKKSKRHGRSSLQSIVGSLRLFLRYCHDRKLLAARLDEIDRPRKYRDERPPRAISWDLAQALLKSISRRTHMGCRDHAMLYLMTHYGLRTGEVCDLKLEDVNLAKRVLRVTQSKTHQILTLPLTEQAARILKRYLEFGRPRTALPHVFLSILAPLRPVFRTSVAAIFQRRVKDAALPLADYSPYCLRHGFAMRLLGRGVGIVAIGDLLGHRNLDSTSAYLRINTEAMRDVALQVPRVRVGGAA
jgi:integrase/recombinase XerD